MRTARNEEPLAKLERDTEVNAANRRREAIEEHGTLRPHLITALMDGNGRQMRKVLNHAKVSSRPRAIVGRGDHEFSDPASPNTRDHRLVQGTQQRHDVVASKVLRDHLNDDRRDVGEVVARCKIGRRR